LEHIALSFALAATIPNLPLWH